MVLGGDVRERSTVLDLLPPPLQEATVTVDREALPAGPRWRPRFAAAELGGAPHRAGFREAFTKAVGEGADGIAALLRAPAGAL